MSEIYLSSLKASRDRDQSNALKIEEMEAFLATVKAEANDVRTEAKQIIEETMEQVNAAQAEAALDRENAAKEISQMHDLIEREQKGHQEALRLAALAEEAAAAAKEKASRFEVQAIEAAELRQKLDELNLSKEHLSREIARLKTEVERAAERFEVEKERVALAAERASLDEVKKLHEEIRQLRISLDDMREKAEEQRKAFQEELAKVKQR